MSVSGFLHRYFVGKCIGKKLVFSGATYYFTNTLTAGNHFTKAWITQMQDPFSQCSSIGRIFATSRGEPECLHIGCRAHSQFRNPPQKDKGQINRLQRESAKLHSHHIIQDLGKVIIMLTSLIILRRISTLIFETKTWICLFK